ARLRSAPDELSERSASPLTSQEMAKATMAIDSGMKIGMSSYLAMPVHSTQTIITSPHARQMSSRRRLSGGRSRRRGVSDFRNSHTANRMNDRNRAAAAP